MKNIPKDGIYGQLTKNNQAHSKRYRALRHMECNPGWPLEEVVRKFRLHAMELRAAGNGMVKIRVYADKPHNVVCDGMWMTRAEADAVLAVAVY